MDAQYIVVTTLHLGVDKNRKRVVVKAGNAVTLSDEDAAPLLACKAVRLPEVAPVGKQTATSNKK